jgi:aerobic carbon-monoxide dehydrogenase medium subunit
MKPVAFDYERPGTIDDAVKLLSDPHVFSKVVAGSQSLGPMLNLRLAQPELLVDITAIPELRIASVKSDFVELGACVTHADVEDDRVPDVTNGLLRCVAQRIAYRAVRNRGTIGGSLAHSDPAADWVSVFPLLAAEVVVQSNRGQRTIAAENFMISSFVTRLESNEIIRAIRIPKMSKDARWGFFKFNQKAGEFAHIIGAVLHDPSAGRFRAIIGAIEAAPILVADARVLFDGDFGPRLEERLDQHALLSLLDNAGVDDEYIRQLALVSLKRAAKQASES